MKSVLYCGCTVNAYMPFHGEHSLSLLAQTSLFHRGFSLSLSVAHDVAICAISRSLAAGSANESARRRAFTAFLRHGGGCGRLGLLPPQRSYCFSHPQPPHPTPPATTPNAQPSPSSRLRFPPRPSPRWRYHSILSLLPPRRPPPCPWSRAQESARPPPTALCLEF